MREEIKIILIILIIKSFCNDFIFSFTSANVKTPIDVNTIEANVIILNCFIPNTFF